jgi:hypothetical protein
MAALTTAGTAVTASVFVVKFFHRVVDEFTHALGGGG